MRRFWSIVSRWSERERPAEVSWYGIVEGGDGRKENVIVRVVW